MKTLKTIFDGCCYTFSGCGCLFLILCFVPMILIMGSCSSNMAKMSGPAPFKGGMVVIDMGTRITEAPTSHSRFMNFLNESEGSIGIRDFAAKIKAAQEDPLVRGIVLTGSFTGSNVSFAQTAELRKWLYDFKASNKPVYAYLENPTLRDYYLASVSNVVYVNPSSAVEFNGVSIKSLFVGNALKKYGINADIIRAGKYKNAVETFTSDKMSPESKEVYSEIANGLWAAILRDVAASRNIPEKELQNIADEKGILTAKEAIFANLADESAHRDLFINKMSEIAGVSHCENTFSQTSIQAYNTKRSLRRDRFGQKRDSAIAVVYMGGQIIEGDARVEGTITGNYYASILKGLRNDEKIKGVVLRINSPGGSAYASEQIRHEVELLKLEKPVVSSFGASAASGGYWIAAPSSKIVSQENTLTGSIGVFGIVFSGKRLAGDFGITFDGVETSNLADIMSGTRPMTEAEQKIIQGLVDETYEQFLTIVSEGRNMPKSDVEKIAQGRVWLASAAKKTNLFDGFGNIEDAIEICKELAKADANIGIREFPKPETFGDFLNNRAGIERPFTKLRMLMLPKEVSETMKFLENKSIIRAQDPYIITLDN